MAVFSYRAVDLQCNPINGVVTADTLRQARDQVRSQGLTIQSISERRGSNRRVTWLSQRRNQPWLIDLARELSTLVAVGVPLLDALDTIARGQGPARPGNAGKNRRSAVSDTKTAWRHRLSKGGSRFAVLLRLREDIASGLGLADAMREQPGVFDDLTIHLCEVGEHTGNLESVLNDLADFKEKASQLRGRISSALIYPAIVLTTGLIVTVFLMTFVVPNLLDALIEEGRSLPAVTLVVKSISDFMIDQWWMLLLLSAGAVACFFLITAKPRGRLLWHRLLLQTPVLGELIRKQAVVRVAIVMATLMRSGVTFMKSIKVVQESTHNLVLRRGLVECEKAVMAGRDISQALDATRVFPPTVLQVFQIGQETGRLEEMLERLAVDYDRQVKTAASRFTAALEPILIILLALVVGAIAFATILPILEAGNVL